MALSAKYNFTNQGSALSKPLLFFSWFLQDNQSIALFLDNISLPPPFTTIQVGF